MDIRLFENELSGKTYNDYRSYVQDIVNVVNRKYEMGDISREDVVPTILKMLGMCGKDKNVKEKHASMNEYSTIFFEDTVCQRYGYEIHWSVTRTMFYMVTTTFGFDLDYDDVSGMLHATMDAETYASLADNGWNVFRADIEITKVGDHLHVVSLEYSSPIVKEDEEDHYAKHFEDIADYWGGFMPLMLMEEMGELAQAVSKHERSNTEGNAQDVVDEMGDVIISVFATASHYGIDYMRIKDRIDDKIGMDYDEEGYPNDYLRP